MTESPHSTQIAVDLSVAINAAFAEAHATAAVATTNARLALAQAMECGRLLIRQKECLRHGDWQPWLAANCPRISLGTARCYMRLAKRSAGADLSEATGLRQAYLATGILTATPRNRHQPDATTPTVAFTRGLDQFRRWFHHRTDELPLDQWTPEARRLLRNELAWFKKLHDRLGR